MPTSCQPAVSPTKRSPLFCTYSCSFCCRDWDNLNDSATHPSPAPWYPPSSRPADTAYIVASPPPTSPRKPWEGTLREIAPQQQQQQLIRSSAPLHMPQQSGQPQHAVQQCQHTTTQLPQGQAACRPSVHPHYSSQSPVPAPRYESPTPNDRAQLGYRPVPEGGGRPHHIDRAISAQEWEGFAVAAHLNGQDEGRARQPAPGPAPQGRQAGGASPTRPQYLLLPEAESYDSFMLLAHAFRQWRSHAASEQTMRYAAGYTCALAAHSVACFHVFCKLVCLCIHQDMAQERFRL